MLAIHTEMVSTDNELGFGIFLVCPFLAIIGPSFVLIKENLHFSPSWMNLKQSAPISKSAASTNFLDYHVGLKSNMTARYGFGILLTNEAI